MKRSSIKDAASRLQQKTRKGVFLVLGVIGIVAVLTFVGMSVDLGYITVTKTQMQGTADAAALAAAQEIVVGIREAGEDGITDLAAVQAHAASAARDMAADIVTANGLFIDPTVDVELGNRLLAEDGISYVETWGAIPYNMVKVTIRKTNTDSAAPDAKLPLFFAPVMGDKSQALTTEATAFIESRDIVSVLDYSGSMKFDSIFRSETVNRIGKPAVEDGLDDIWDALVASEVAYSDDPGVLKFPATGYGNINSYYGTYVSSSNTGDIFDQLNLEQTTTTTVVTTVTTTIPGENYWDNWQYKNGTYRKTSGSYKYKKNPNGSLKRKNRWGGGSWKTISDTLAPGYFPSTESTEVEEEVEEQVTTTSVVPFPQEGKSSGVRKGKPSNSESEDMWEDYIDFVKNNLNSYGYKKRYGYRSLMHYLIDKRASNSQSEDLWRAPIYPHYGMKQGMTKLATFLDNLGYGDHMGLVTYASTSRIETGLWDDGADVTVDLGDDHLTEEVMDIDTIQRHKQAAHYNPATGIGYGLEDARELLDDQGRYGAQKAILLMTDGQSNQYPSGFDSSSLPSDWDWDEITDFDGDGEADVVIDSGYTSGGNGDGNWKAALHSFLRAKEAFDAGYTVHTISMGDGADTVLMGAIAQMSGGEYVHIPSGSTNEAMEEALEDAFAVMAGQVPPARLVIGDE